MNNLRHWAPWVLGTALTATTPVAFAAPDSSLSALMPNYPAASRAAPVEADIVFSPRMDRPEAPTVAAAFLATRIEWTYISDKSKLTALKASIAGGHTGGTINNNLQTPANAGAAINFDGQPIIAPWMRSWGAIWNTCAAPESMRALKDHISQLLQAGVHSIQFDDPGMQFDSESWGAGDFSANSLKGFRQWVQQQGTGAALPITAEDAGDYRNWLRSRYGIKDSTDYLARRSSLPTTNIWRAYLRSAVDACLQDLHTYVAEKSAGQAGLSMNVYTPYPWSANTHLLPYTDYVIGEMEPTQTDYTRLYFLSQWLRAAGKRWSPVFTQTSIKELRVRIATAYASGATPVVPWDVWIPPVAGQASPPGRFYGKPQDFNDLFSFVRQNHTLLDGWETLSRLSLIYYADQPDPDQAFTQLRRLADAQVPYVALPHVAGFDLTKPRSSPSVRTLRLNNNAHYISDKQALLMETSDAALAELAVASGVTPGIQVLVKGNTAKPSLRIVHLIRTREAANGDMLVKLALKAWSLPEAKAYQMTLQRPGEAPINMGMRTKQEDGVVTLELANIKEWALLEITAQ